ncbi:Phosphoacetylglucosamine mutase [Morella rubra]|uniref:Phosphoacetylglucosamine mutase n=1 Tax=Morella rubra TaxID=262757 RepID=A0A6A1VSH4_9ROSI|nr:Phosphoacetylglucosamine mutase [Morella rubra]
MKEEQRSLLLSSSSRFPPPQGVRLSYGTSGFRADAAVLESTVYRMGILAALRSLNTESSVIGIMITASHNKVSDNGVKIADPSGGMLSQEWEPFADALANAPTPQHLLQLITEFVEKESILLETVRPAEILLGRDTRPSGESLLEATKQGISSILGAVTIDMGIVTTPQLHWMAFTQLMLLVRCLTDLIPSGGRKMSEGDEKLVVDGANGVGGEKLELLNKMLDGLLIDVRNSGKDGGILNEGVGADYVQKEKLVPQGFDSQDIGLSCSKIELVDGDKILSLFAIFIKEQLSSLNEGGENTISSYQAHLGVVQTAYANGASTDYLKKLGLEVVFTPTGVKYLHEKAAEYDVGIYFEANGHGTILFSESFLLWLQGRHKELSAVSKGSEQEKAALRLLAVSKLINQAVGDALSGLLLVEAVLRHMGWSIHRWSDLYQDLPSRQIKVKVVDRTAVVTANAETMVVQPPGIQEAINAETAKYPQGRSFIRPSGTEDVIRVYAEASTQEGADSLANSVATLVRQFLGPGSS